jgi:hypothetical protein
MRAAHAVAQNLAPSPEERRPVSEKMLLYRGKYRGHQQYLLEGTMYGKSTVYLMKSFTAIGALSSKRLNLSCRKLRAAAFVNKVELLCRLLCRKNNRDKIRE